MSKTTNEKEYSFIKEKIKDKPMNKKKILLRIGLILGISIVIGLVASFVVAFTQPYIQKWLYGEEPKITIPKDELVEPEDDVVAEPPLVGDTVYVTETQPLELADYQVLQNKLYAVGKNANKSIVTVTGVISEMDWYNNPYENEGQASGIIIANNGVDLLILTERKVIQDADAIRVTFIDGTVLDASLRQYDGNTGVAILSIPLEKITPETMGRVALAELGNSLGVNSGKLAIAIGSPLGSVYSILMGTITSTGNQVTTNDYSYGVFTTDIVSSSSGNGVLIDLEGKVMGLIMQDFSNKADQNTITAISISELKDIIEKLSNNTQIAYLGLRGSTVTDDIATKYGLPKGMYVTNAAMDSPAMAAGIQSGDVVVEINKTEILTTDNYEDCLSGLNPQAVISIVIMRQGAEGYIRIDCSATLGVLK